MNLAAPSPKALILEDEPSLSTALKLSLKKMGFTTTCSSTLKEAQTQFATHKGNFSLLLLDRQLPDGDSLSLCKELRRSGFKGMILMLTASGDTHARVEGLRAGADDYLPKPFSWEELEARIEALRKRLPEDANTRETSHLWRLNSKEQKVLTPAGWKKLTSIEFKLLAYLMENSDRRISKEELLKQVWGLKILPKTRTVDWFIGRLRRMVETDPKDPKHIINERSRGYFFQP